MKFPIREIIRCSGLVIVCVLPLSGLLVAQTVDEGVLLFQQGQYSEAKKVFEQILEKDENNAEAHFQLGRVYFSRASMQRDIEEAVNEFEKAVNLNSENAEYQFRYGAALGEKTQKSGIIKQALLAPKVKKAFKQAVELNPQHAQARLALAQFYLIAPAILGGDKEEGWKQLEEAIRLDEVPGRIVKAHMLAQAKRSDEAEKEFKALTVSKPNEWRSWKAYGYFCIRREKYDEALGHFQKYVELRPDTADSYQSLAEAFLKKGDADQALLQLNKSLSIDSVFVPAIISMGEAYQQKGQKVKAKEAFQHVLSITQNEYFKNQIEQKLKEIE
jgi:tetratricopeptide (TPR) repeat protein